MSRSSGNATILRVGVASLLGKVIVAASILGMPLAKADTCQEDDVCWDWRTMGNHCQGFDSHHNICYNDGSYELRKKV